MARPSFYDTLRRRVAPLVLLAGLALLGTRTCASEMAQVEVHLLLGEARARVQTVRVDVFRDGEGDGVAYFERNLAAGDAGGPGGEVSFEMRLDPGTYRLHIEVGLDGGVRVVERSIHVRDQARVDVDLAPALAAGAAT